MSLALIFKINIDGSWTFRLVMDAMGIIFRNIFMMWKGRY